MIGGTGPHVITSRDSYQRTGIIANVTCKKCAILNRSLETELSSLNDVTIELLVSQGKRNFLTPIEGLRTESVRYVDIFSQLVKFDFRSRRAGSSSALGYGISE